MSFTSIPLQKFPFLHSATEPLRIPQDDPGPHLMLIYYPHSVTRVQPAPFSCVDGMIVSFRVHKESLRFDIRLIGPGPSRYTVRLAPSPLRRRNCMHDCAHLHELSCELAHNPAVLQLQICRQRDL